MKNVILHLDYLILPFYNISIKILIKIIEIKRNIFWPNFIAHFEKYNIANLSKTQIFDKEK